MTHEIPRLIVDLGTPCPKCKVPGAVIRNGLVCNCFSCALDEIKSGKKGAGGQLPSFWLADPEIERLAARLISQYHPEAATARICYLFRKKHGMKNGAIQLGKCHKVGAREKALHGFDYIILLAWDMWMLFNGLEREALLLHEILHIFKDEKGENPAWKIEPHNVEEFSKVIAVYGLWKPDLEAFAEAIYKRGREDSVPKQVAVSAPKRAA